MMTSKQIYFAMTRSLLSHEVIIWYTSQRVKDYQKSLNIKLKSMQEKALWQIIDVYRATSTETLQMKINMMSINIHLWKLIQRSITNMNSWKSDEVIEMIMHWIRNDLTFKKIKNQSCVKHFYSWSKSEWKKHSSRRKWIEIIFTQWFFDQNHWR